METRPLEGIIITADDPGGLVALDTFQRPLLDLFTDPAVIPAVLDAVGTLARDFQPDPTSDKGRKEIAARAFKVARTKTFLDDLGKEEVARLKELPKQVDAGRKTLRDGLDQLRDEIRKPLTEWETRVQNLKDQLAAVENLPTRFFQAPAALILEQVEALQAMPTDKFIWQEFAEQAETVRRVTLATLEEMHEKATKAEAERAELERLRAEKAERDRLDREEQLRREGEERARRQAEEAAQRAMMTQGQPVPPPIIDTPAPTSAAPSAPVPTPSPAADLEHRRAFNREALADLETALVGCNPGKVAEAALRAIVQGKIRHISITY